jgi:hypothetical protein
MVSTVKTQPHLPLKRFLGTNQQLDLYPNHLVLNRTDFLARWFPAVFGSTQEIPFDDIDRVYIHQEEYDAPRLMYLVIALTNHRQIGVMFTPKDYDQAEAMKNRIDDFLSKREPYPEPVS